jgi:hypothetical protein
VATGPGRAQRVEQRAQLLEDRYIVAAGLIVLSIIATAVGGDHRIGQAVFVLVESLTLVVILHASKVPPRARTIATVAIVVAALATWTSIAFDRQSIGPGIVGATLAFVGPVVIVRRISQHARIDVETVAASLCVYLLAGMFFAYVFRIMHDLDAPFFAQHVHDHAADYVYYSFSTLTTLGYGDFTARTAMGRMVSVSEALLGQLYLVSVVALFVGNIGGARLRRAARDSAVGEEGAAE